MNENLNPQQLKAATHPGGPLLIVAGAGSGKTKTLTSRIAHLIAAGVHPSRILAITFTNKAAKEMLRRVESIMGNVGRAEKSEDFYSTFNISHSTSQRPFIGTFHSWGARFLQEEGYLLGRKSHFSIFDDDDTLRLLKEICKVMDLDKERYNPLMFRSRISAIKNELRDASELKETGDHVDELVATVFDRYESALLKNNAFDFDDLLEKVVRIFTRFPEVLEKHRARYDHILVDEYQDVNTSQYRLVNLLAAKHKNLSVVGDDAQSIYKFRGSDFRNFLRFDRDWPEVTIIKLEENYRSTGNILAAATQIIKNNKQQRPKTLWTKKGNGELIKITGLGSADDEAYYIISQIVKIFDDPKKDPQIAILYRTNAQSRPIEQALLQNSIPYHIYGGLKFYERMEVKDILCALQYATNPQNNVAAERLRKNFSKKESTFLLAQLPRLAGELKIIELINFFLENTKYLEYLDANYKNSRERVENVNELIAFAGTFNHLGLPAFLEQVSLVSSLDMPNGKVEVATSDPATRQSRNGAGKRQATRKTSGGVVNLMTVHAAKGLEFNQVFLAGCNEGLLPHERSLFNEGELEEERRLMYVATTRPRQELQISFFDTPSRFLYEIPEELTIFKNHATPSYRNTKGLGSFEDEDYISYD